MPFGAAAATRSLSLGLSGTDVTAVQNELIAEGYMTGAATGYFGAVTQAAVEKFQCAKAIICSDATVTGYGIAGPRTQAVLASSVSATPPVQPSAVTGTSLTGPATGKFEISGWVPDWRAATGTMDVLPIFHR